MLICMLIATIVFIFFSYLFMTAGDPISAALLVVHREIETDKIEKLQIKMDSIVAELKETGDLKNKKLIKEARNYKKQQEESKKLLKRYEAGKLDILDLIPTAGYRLIQLLKWDNTNPTVKQLSEKCQQYKDKKEAVNYTYYILSALFGYVLFGISIGFLVSGLAMGKGLGTKGLAVGIVAMVVFLMLGYLPYDEVNNTVEKRKEQFGDMSRVD